MTEKPPTGLSAAGRRLWSSVTVDYELDEHERRLLIEACRSADLLDQLAEALRRDGPMVDGPAGLRVHPAAVESRQQKIALARLLAALRLPAGSEEDRQATARPQRRAGVRGVYRLPGVAS